MPRATHHRQCRKCDKWFTSVSPNALYCKVCKDASDTAATYGPRWRLVSCAHILDLGLIGCENTLPIWLQLDVVGAVIRNGNQWMRYDGASFQPCDNPWPPARQIIERMAPPPPFVESV